MTFALEISEPTAGVKLSKKNLCFIDIIPEDKAEDQKEVHEHQMLMKYFMDSKNVSWGDQFKNAVMLGPSISEDNTVDDVTCGEAIMHFLTMPWKVIFAVVPPRNMLGGWLAFVVALGMIGGIVVIVGEYANLLGCTVDLKTSVTAITIVALGTSLPDTFASKTAA